MTGLPPVLRIESRGPLGRGTVVTLDGVEVPGLVALRLDMTTEDMNVVGLTIEVGEVQVSAEVLTELQAHVERAKGD